ncbi:alpha/beta fold hydrolase [Clostridium sp. MCC353]|uniref:alpha/beta fold hydrolase n=1 Tax=Clostridium sp. MCC353 TaxID=2592646 RepID=UPI001C025C35|nr:alpha/beta fold hydrolase [Clostridium sp. MCC353]MBT9779397.1 alpha/beta fold hydrolase [Clostridium sp. MCC353]
MRARNKLLTLLIVSSGAAAGTALLNKCITLSAASKNVLSEAESRCYKWRLGNIHYTKVGSGKPLLLVHDLTSASSGFEWNLLVNKLSDSFTVYTIDLLGCGRSEKPYLTYTNYLFVQLLSEFIKSEIGHRTDIIATGASSSIVVMACNNSPELFNQLLLINPEDLSTCSHIPGRYSKFYKAFLDLPILGSLIYNIANSKEALKKEFAVNYFFNPYSVKNSYIDAYYEAAHLGDSPKSIFASVICYYTKCNIINALKKIDNSIYILGGSETDHMNDIIREYKDYNPAIESSVISNTKLLPHLENPSEVLKVINMYFA